MITGLLCASCGEYNKLLKSTDYELKYSYAKKYFNEKKYAKDYLCLRIYITGVPYFYRLRSYPYT